MSDSSVGGASGNLSNAAQNYAQNLEQVAPQKSTQPLTSEEKANVQATAQAKGVTLPADLTKSVALADAQNYETTHTFPHFTPPPMPPPSGAANALLRLSLNSARQFVVSIFQEINDAALQNWQQSLTEEASRFRQQTQQEQLTEKQLGSNRPGVPTQAFSQGGEIHPLSDFSDQELVAAFQNKFPQQAAQVQTELEATCGPEFTAAFGTALIANALRCGPSGEAPTPVAATQLSPSQALADSMIAWAADPANTSQAVKAAVTLALVSIQTYATENQIDLATCLQKLQNTIAKLNTQMTAQQTSTALTDAKSSKWGKWGGWFGDAAEVIGLAVATVAVVATGAALVFSGGTLAPFVVAMVSLLALGGIDFLNHRRNTGKDTDLQKWGQGLTKELEDIGVPANIAQAIPGIAYGIFSAVVTIAATFGSAGALSAVGGTKAAATTTKEAMAKMAVGIIQVSAKVATITTEAGQGLCSGVEGWYGLEGAKQTLASSDLGVAIKTLQDGTAQSLQSALTTVSQSTQWSLSVLEAILSAYNQLGSFQAGNFPNA